MTSSDPPSLVELNHIASALNEPQLYVLLRMARAMHQPFEGHREPSSTIATPGFFTAFGNELLLYHAVHQQRLSKKTFEYLFMYACRADRRRAYINENSTAAAGDVIVDNVPFSLKTQADKNIKANAIYIQKLMEARWIRNCDTPEDFASAAAARIPAHMKRYQKILMLRAVKTTATHHTYELLEIPTAIFARVGTLKAENYEPKNKYGSSAAYVRDDANEIMYRMLLDGSVEKVRIFNLRRWACIFHAQWTVPFPAATTPDDEE